MSESAGDSAPPSSPSPTRAFAIPCALLLAAAGSLLWQGGGRRAVAEDSPAASEAPAPPAARIDGTGPGWRALTEADFENVNCLPETWTWTEEGARCTGLPVGVIRTKEVFTNFELVAEWMHETPAGNSGIFVWAIEESMKDLPPGKLPHGVEVQILDHGYTEKYERESGGKATWFTTNGDVFRVGAMKLTPFAPVSPDGSRSFPRENRSLGHGQWNHYYVRAINGEVRLWVNGGEVSGGTDASPRSGPLCLESEGAPIRFRNLRIRTLP